MVDDRRAMYDGFSDKGGHSTEWVWIIKEFLKVAFAGGHHEASYPCSMYENRRILSKYEMFVHLDKNGFMSNYMVWHQHREVQPLVADVLDGNDDEDRMDDMIVDIGRGYVLKSADPQLEVHNFYRLIVASEEKNARWHRCDHSAGCDPSYDDEIKVQLLESVLQRYRQVDY
jgi:hypothetical protein